MSQIWEYIKIALMNIKSNKGRSILTMLGIIIGISSVIMIISIGNGVKGGINDELSNMAGEQVYIYSYGDNEEGIIVDFTEEDMEALMETVPNIKGITPQWTFSGTSTGRKGSFPGMIYAGNSDLQYVKQEPMAKGRYFTENDFYMANKVCVINEGGAKMLFGTTNVIGMTIDVTTYNFTNEEFTIVGIRKDKESSLMTMLDEETLELEMPLSVMGWYYVVYYNDMVIICDGAEHASQVANDALRILENRHGVRGKNAIQVQSLSDYMDEINQIVNLVTAFVVLVAAISLLVGGIGVMNIMLVSVTERTREIGIRKALGARTGSIMLQFLAESAIISLLGGVIGIALGVSGAAGICALFKLTVKLDVATILGASLFSTAVGVFFGMYPAKKAANLSPIEALRHE